MNPEDFSINVFCPNPNPWVPNNNRGVRITYLPTGDFVERADSRSQHLNKAAAMKELLFIINKYPQQKELF